MNDRKRLLIVDDSKMMRKAITKFFEGNGEIEVAGEAASGEEALQVIDTLNPDVVTLDVNMPGMDGLSTLKRLMIHSPRPTVMLSTLTQEGTQTTFDALRYGAVDFIPKPDTVNGAALAAQAEEVIAKVKLATAVTTEAIQYIRAATNEKVKDIKTTSCQRLVAIGAAEGGYSTLLKIIPQLRPDAPAAYLLMLHAGSQYVDAFANYLNIYSPIRVVRAKHGQLLESGCCYLGAGNEYLTVNSEAGQFSLNVHPAPFTTRRGSIDMLMFSVAEAMENNAVGVILSGSGQDGSEGLEEILSVGGSALVQDPKSCLHKEMANSALTRCSISFVFPDVKMATVINELH